MINFSLLRANKSLFLVLLTTLLVFGSQNGVAKSVANVNGVGSCITSAYVNYLPTIMQTSKQTGSMGISADFAMVVPPCLIGVRGYDGETTVTLDSFVTEAISADLSSLNLPNGVSATFGEPTLSTGDSTQFYLTVPANVALGSYHNIGVQGKMGDKTSLTYFTLIVIDPVEIKGKVVIENGAAASGSQITLSMEGSDASQTVSADANGDFSGHLPIAQFPAKILAEAQFKQTGLPALLNGKWATASTYQAPIELDSLILPDLAGATMTISAEQATTSDGSVTVVGLPPEVNTIFARTYDPDLQPTLFPGEFMENGEIPLNSANFLWIEALDADGNPVDNFAEAVTIHSRVPYSQWGDLEDIVGGNDRIDIPIYVYDEESHLWQQVGNGWLEDAQGTVLPEDANVVILDGTYNGDLFATFESNHFSWMNVDYAYIGPWTLSRLTSDERNNDCLYNATRLAETIFRTELANKAYAGVNKPGTKLSEEVLDGGASELKSDNTLSKDTYGQTTANDFKDHLYLNSALWSSCDTKKDETVFMMAATILHETAHWKHDVKKFDGVYTDEADVGGEGGLYVEGNLFGSGNSIWSKNGLPIGDGIYVQNGANETAITADHLTKLNDPQWWKDNEGKMDDAFWTNFWANPKRSREMTPRDSSPLEITISAESTAMAPGQPVVLRIRYRNISADPISVLKLNKLEGYPLFFRIIDAEGKAVPFIGAKIKRQITSADFITLNPNETFEFTLDITQEIDSAPPAQRQASSNSYYNFTRGGHYTITAYYGFNFGLPETASNPLPVDLSLGGTVSGRISDAQNGEPLAGATVSLLRDGKVIAQTETLSDGQFNFGEVPVGTFIVKVFMPGFLRTTKEAVVVSAEETTINMSLSPLLVQGQLRIVLTWGETTVADLDAHLWLPAATPYHISYSDAGNIDMGQCPFAYLDVDDTSYGGPETITIGQLLEGDYLYAIHNYSYSPDLSTSEAHVQIFDSSGLLATFDVPSGDGEWWHVFTLDGSTGAITEVNQLSTNPAPYEFGDGCVAPTP